MSIFLGTCVNIGWWGIIQPYPGIIHFQQNERISVYVRDWFEGGCCLGMRFPRFLVFFSNTSDLTVVFFRSIWANNSSFELVLPMGFLFCCCYHRLWRCGRACVFLALRLLLLHDDGGSWGGVIDHMSLVSLEKNGFTWGALDMVERISEALNSIMSLVYNYNFLVDFLWISSMIGEVIHFERFFCEKGTPFRTEKDWFMRMKIGWAQS